MTDLWVSIFIFVCLSNGSPHYVDGTRAVLNERNEN